MDSRYEFPTRSVLTGLWVTWGKLTLANSLWIYGSIGWLYIGQDIAMSLASVHKAMNNRKPIRHIRLPLSRVGMSLHLFRLISQNFHTAEPRFSQGRKRDSALWGDILQTGPRRAQ